MDIEKEYFVGASIWAPILLGQFQNKSEFETEHGKTYPFASKVESSIPTLRGTCIISMKKLFSKFFSKILINSVMR